MRRDALCKIAGINPSTFNVHRMNDDLPFDIVGSEGQDSAGRTWSNFTMLHAARLLAARQLVAQGVRWAEACEILRTRAIGVGGMGFGHQYYDRSGVFVARVRFGDSVTNDDPEWLPPTRVYIGPLEKILEAATGTAKAVSARHAVKNPIVVTGLVAVDLSHCWTLAHEIARRLQIPVASGDQLDPYDHPLNTPNEEDGEE